MKPHSSYLPRLTLFLPHNTHTQIQKKYKAVSARAYVSHRTVIKSSERNDFGNLTLDIVVIMFFFKWTDVVTSLCKSLWGIIYKDIYYELYYNAL